MPFFNISNPMDGSPPWSRSACGLFLFFLSSLFLLALAGFIFKIVFVIYNDAAVSEMLLAEVAYALLWGLRFDFASAAMFSLLMSFVLWFLYRFSPEKKSPSNKAALILLSVSLVAQMSFQVADSIYYTDAGRHVSYEMRDVISDASGLFLTAMAHHTWFILCSAVFGIVLLLFCLRFSQWIMVRAWCHKCISLKLGLQYEVSLLCIVVVAMIGIRGGLTGLPQSVTSAFKIGDSQQAVVTMNGSYSVIYGIFNSSKEVKRFAINLPEDINVNEVMKQLYPSVSFGEADKEGKKYNLIFVFMEGWPAELMASYGYDQKTTPFFDSLLEKSYAPLGIIAGGRRTTEGLFSTLCSQQNPLGETVAQSSLQNFSYSCLPEILKNKGWSTAFFQGSHKETSGTGAFAQSLGFVESYAKEDMPVGRYQRNFWGAHDPDIYDFVITKIDTMPEPFMVGINTNSTHDISLPDGVEPTFKDDEGRDKKRNVLHFADQAMREFFDKLKNKSYYKNTLFVFMSDHTSGRRSSRFAKYLIPGAIYAEGIIPARELDQFVSQRDIAPTILDILDLPASSSFAGKSFYRSTERKSDDEYFSDYYNSGNISWVSGHDIVETNINQPDVIKCYSINIETMDVSSKQCDAHSRHLSEQSLVFTSYSQDRLFKGETKQFYKFLND